jgi:ATP-dependent Clp protease adaptor protein ClpS
MSVGSGIQTEQKRSTRTRQKPRPRRQPPYHVVLLDDNDHTYEYVVEMLARLFGHPRPKAYLMAREVDTSGRVIVDTTTKERAELKRDQIHAYGRDWRIERCRGSMSATIEPAEDSEA